MFTFYFLGLAINQKSAPRFVEFENICGLTKCFSRFSAQPHRSLELRQGEISASMAPPSVGLQNLFYKTKIFRPGALVRRLTYGGRHGNFSYSAQCSGLV